MYLRSLKSACQVIYVHGDEDTKLSICPLCFSAELCILWLSDIRLEHNVSLSENKEFGVNNLLVSSDGVILLFIDKIKLG